MKFVNFFSFTAEIQDIFKGPIFAQLMSSVIIICMTCFMLVNQIDNVVQFGSTVAYLITMVTQILLFCWIGNELIYSVSNQHRLCSTILISYFYNIMFLYSLVDSHNKHIFQTFKHLINLQQRLCCVLCKGISYRAYWI